MKWNDTIERMMLIKLVEQNPGMKLNVDEALATWPTELDQPTKRGLTDRFSSIKKQLKDGNLTVSVGTGTIMTPLSVHRQPGQLIPRTPKPLSKTSKAGNKQMKPDPDASPNPIITATGSSSTSFKSRLLGCRSASSTAVKCTKRIKRKRKSNSDSETSMSDHESENTSNEEAAGDKSPSESARAASAGRRTLPRRSKSMTPARYQVDNDDDDDDDDHEDSQDKEGSATEAGSESEAKSNKRICGAKVINGQVNSTDKTSGKGRVKEAVSRSDEETDDSGDSFDPAGDRLLQRDGQKKTKAGWRERIAMMDGREEEMQD